MGRHPSAHVGNLLQFRLALGILFLGSHLLSQRRMALSEEDSGIARDGHCLQFLLLVGRLWVVDIVETGYLPFDAGLHVKQALTIHLAIHRRMTCGALLHKLREHTGVVSLFPLA